jgi:hypothetical protein
VCDRADQPVTYHNLCPDTCLDSESLLQFTCPSPEVCSQTGDVRSCKARVYCGRSKWHHDSHLSWYPTLQTLPTIFFVSVSLRLLSWRSLTDWSLQWTCWVVSYGSSVNTVTRTRGGGPWFDCWQRYERNFSLRHRVQTGSGAHLASYLMSTGDLPAGVKRPGC